MIPDILQTPTVLLARDEVRRAGSERSNTLLPRYLRDARSRLRRKNEVSSLASWWY